MEEINEMIKLAENIISQNCKGALMYVLTANDHVEIKDNDIIQEMFSKIIE